MKFIKIGLQVMGNRVLVPFSSVIYPFFFVVSYIKSFPRKTFDQKVQYKMLFDRRAYLHETADKYKAKLIAQDLIGEAGVAKLYQVQLDANEIDWANLPQEYVIKVNHGCGGTIIVCREGIDLAEILDSKGKIPLDWKVFRINPNSLNRAVIQEYFSRLMQKNYGWGDPFPLCYEWLYRSIKPRIIIEEFLNIEGRSPIDYRLFVMNGAVQFIQRDEILPSVHYSSLYNVDWQLQDVDYNYIRPSFEISPPSTLKSMIGYAEELARNTDFARIDFYEVGKRLVFGEITHYPRAGRNVFTPVEFSKFFAAKWKVPKSYKKLPPTY